MPVLSQYWFDLPDFLGNTEFLSQPHPAGGWAWINWADTGGKRSTLVWEREDRELVVDLVPLANAPDVLAAVDGMIHDPVSRTSGIRAGWIPWKYVPFHETDPGRHGDLDLLVHLAFDIHVHTPWYCSDADGNINYYVVAYLDGSGHLGAYVDWWSWHFDGGGPFCTGAIADGLNTAVPGGVPALQAILDSRLALFSGRVFDLLYLLPGSGDRSGVGSVNVNDHCSLAVLPR